MAADEYSGSYTWNLTDFNECKVNERKTGETFNIGPLPFTLEAYPNGDNETNVGSFMLYCTLLSIPDNCKEIILNLRLYCKETNSSFTSIAIFTLQRNSAGWTHQTILLKEIQQLNLNNITIGCHINILKIISNDNDIIYKHQVADHNNNNNHKSIYSFEWKIDAELIKLFKNCRIGKAFESEIFDNLFCLRCLPNGKRANDAGNAKLYLLLCAIPPIADSVNDTDTDSIHILYTLWCNETNTGYNSKIVLNYEYCTVGWPNKILLTQQINHENIKSLTFNAEIEIISQIKTASSPADTAYDDSSTYSSSTCSDYGVKSIFSEDESEQNDENDENISIPPQIEEKKEFSPPQLQIPIIADAAPNHIINIDEHKESDEGKTEQFVEAKEDNLKVKKKKKHIHKHHKNKKRLTLSEFKAVSLEDLIESDVHILDNYDIAKKICKYFDKQFDDTDSVCMVADKDKQPTISYWVKGLYVKTRSNIWGKHILVYRASKHVSAKKPVVAKKKFEEYVRKLSIKYESGSVDAIADKLDKKFGIGCHYARSTRKSSQYDIYCRYSDKYECGFKLNSGAYIIAWRR